MEATFGKALSLTMSPLKKHLIRRSHLQAFKLDEASFEKALKLDDEGDTLEKASNST